MRVSLNKRGRGNFRFDVTHKDGRDDGIGNMNNEVKMIPRALVNNNKITVSARHIKNIKNNNSNNNNNNNNNNNSKNAILKPARHITLSRNINSTFRANIQPARPKITIRRANETHTGHTPKKEGRLQLKSNPNTPKKEGRLQLKSNPNSNIVRRVTPKTLISAQEVKRQGQRHTDGEQSHSTIPNRGSYNHFDERSQQSGSVSPSRGLYDRPTEGPPPAQYGGGTSRLLQKGSWEEYELPSDEDNDNDVQKSPKFLQSTGMKAFNSPQRFNSSIRSSVLSRELHSSSVAMRRARVEKEKIPILTTKVEAEKKRVEETRRRRMVAVQVVAEREEERERLAVQRTEELEKEVDRLKKEKEQLEKVRRDEEEELRKLEEHCKKLKEEEELEKQELELLRKQNLERAHNESNIREQEQQRVFESRKVDKQWEKKNSDTSKDHPDRGVVKGTGGGKKRISSSVQPPVHGSKRITSTQPLVHSSKKQSHVIVNEKGPTGGRLRSFSHTHSDSEDVSKRKKNKKIKKEVPKIKIEKKKKKKISPKKRQYTDISDPDFDSEEEAAYEQQLRKQKRFYSSPERSLTPPTRLRQDRYSPRRERLHSPRDRRLKIKTSRKHR